MWEKTLLWNKKINVYVSLLWYVDLKVFYNAVVIYKDVHQIFIVERFVARNLNWKYEF